MVNQGGSRSRRIAWLEAIRIFAAVLLLLYHAQLLFTGYAYTPQPTGLLNNLQRLVAPIAEFGEQDLLWKWLTLPTWFGFQFVDVFVLISGFSLVLSLKGKPLEVGSFLKQRLLRILWTFWTVAWLAYPVLWAIGTATNSYSPHPWHIFAGATFPILFDYNGQLLLHTSGPWWFVPLILSLTLLFPYLWYLLRRWGARNLLIVSTLLTLVYRALATYVLGGHPTYVILDTPADWQPFILFLAKLSTFVLGMVVGQAYCQGKGPVFWKPQTALLVGIPVYLVGFVCQFYRLGWVAVDLVLPIGLTLCCMALFRTLEKLRWTKSVFLWLGSLSYSYFLIHNFVVDRTLKLVVQDDLMLYLILLPVMIVGTLVLAVIVDYITPGLKKLVVGVLRDIDYVLTRAPVGQRRSWTPQAGDQVIYQGKSDWKVQKVEKLLDEREFLLCHITDGQRSLWVNEDDLEPTGNAARRREVNPNSAFY